MSPTEQPCWPPLGAVVGDRYRLEAMLSSAPVGAVYSARHLQLPRQFTIKILLGAVAAEDPRTCLRFAHEATTASTLAHPNVVPTVDFGRTSDGGFYLVMDHSDGESLAALLEREGPLEPAVALAIGRQVAAALAHGHARGLVHRSLTPAKVLCHPWADREPFVRVLDFGVGPSATFSPYRAPEQERDGLVDHRADLYALGAMLFEMIGKGGPVNSARRAPSPATVDRLARIISRLIAPDPRDRFASAVAVVTALEEVSAAASGRPIHDRPVSPPPPRSVYQATRHWVGRTMRRVTGRYGQS